MAYMTDDEKYSMVLKELGEVLQDKNTMISCQKWQIEELEAKLAAATEERDAVKGECGILNEQLLVMAAEITKLKGGAV
jgi:predicted nuclease with TOPRIM domain